MRTLYRLIAAGALSAPLIIGAAGIASAATEYESSTTAAGPDGALDWGVCSYADGHGNTHYNQHLNWSGENGAVHTSTNSSTGGHYGDGFGGDGASYHTQTAAAGPDGAFSTHTSSHASTGYGGHDSDDVVGGGDDIDHEDGVESDDDDLVVDED